MLSNPNLYIFAFLALSIGFILILVWYRHKEVQDFKTLGLRILAAENNLEYTSLNFAFTQHLERLNLLPGYGTNIKNLLTGKYHSIPTQFFEGSCMIVEGNFSRSIHIVGVYLEFPTRQFPQFHLKQSVRFDHLKPPENMQKAGSHLLPNWAKSNCSLFTNQATLPQELGKLFSHADGLSKLVDVPNFHMLATSERTLVLYLEGHLKSDIASYQQLEQIAHNLIGIFYSSSSTDENLPDDIKRIKKTN